MQRIAVTGANGFIGRHLVSALAARGHAVTALVRTGAGPDPQDETESRITTVAVGNLTAPANLHEALCGVDVVIHAAAQANVGADETAGEENREMTRQLADAARTAGVQRIIFLSSVRAVAGGARTGTIDDATDPQPADAYGRSKRDCEQILKAADVDWLALRPAAVYGPGGRSLVATLIALAAKPVPLPFARLTAPSSFCAIDNLTAAIMHAIDTPFPDQRFALVADAAPMSAADIVMHARLALGRGSGLLPAPDFAIRAALGAIGRARDADRLLRGLVVNTTALDAWGWQPAVDPLEAVAQMSARQAGRSLAD